MADMTPIQRERMIALLLRHQELLNALGSVSIEVPTLRLAFERLVAAADGPQERSSDGD